MSAKVLIADDSPLVLRMIEKMLEGAGLRVVTARDGIEAIEKAFVEDVSLVILDVTMPRMNGYQACRLLKSEPNTRGLPVVILTSRDQAGDRFWGLQTGADYYITKDAEPQKILELVKQILSREDASGRPRFSEAQRNSLDIVSRVNELLDRKLYEATILSEIGRVARSLVHFDETFTSVMSLVGRVVDFSVGAMAFVEQEDLDVVLMAQRPVAAPVMEEAKARLLEAIAQHRGGTPFARVQARLFAPRVGGPEETALHGFAAFPITTNARLTGLLALGGKAAGRIPADTDDFLGQVANQAWIVLENSRLFERIRNLSIRDSLTDLFNHRHSIEIVATEFDRVGRYEGGVSVLMLDVDHFKRINDEHGHQAGDVVLRDCARVMREQLRSVDAIGRYGGEEFLTVLPHTTYEEARATAERLRRAIEGHVFRAGAKELRVTVSVGVACYPSESVDSPATLIRQADQALYRAKQAGRNRVA
ncbi:MAG: diguanylate cyclase [Vicinamibacteria bacterium]|nr:diguanylate cyclase [Vicinamibacteria bacterium]